MGGLVLPNPPPLRAATATSRTGRSVQLRRWFRKLASRLVSGQEGLVLQQRRQGLPTSSWRVCLEVAPTCLGNDSAARPSRRFSLIVAALAFVPSSGAQPQLSDGSDRRGESVEALAFVPSSGARSPPPRDVTGSGWCR